MTDRELMQQAADVLQAVRDTPASKDEIQKAWIVSDLLKRRLAQPEQEPVAHVYLFDPNGRPRVAWDNAKDIKIGDKLYTATPQRKPLTHPQIHEFDWPDGVSFEDILLFVRAIEAAHGIKGEA